MGEVVGAHGLDATNGAHSPARRRLGYVERAVAQHASGSAHSASQVIHRNHTGSSRGGLISCAQLTATVEGRDR